MKRCGCCVHVGMKISRALVAAVSGVGYPSLVAAVAASVLTFTTARVFAESAPLPPYCDDPHFAECSGSAELDKCATCENCGCVEATRCTTEAGAWEPTSALICAPLVACEDAVITSCVGKNAGDWCGPYMACAPSGGCAVLDGGSWTLKTSLYCARSGSAGPTPPDASSPDASKGPDTSDAGPSPSDPSPSADSGCALVAAGTGSSVLASGSLTLGVVLLWRLRRRRR
ncbi:MAG: hypothetical protein K0S65_2420 [Labilithrix sp.]|nr:hypothetical protein [Labilithrix sp.]